MGFWRRNTKKKEKSLSITCVPPTSPPPPPRPSTPEDYVNFLALAIHSFVRIHLTTYVFPQFQFQMFAVCVCVFMSVRLSVCSADWWDYTCCLLLWCLFFLYKFFFISFFLFLYKLNLFSTFVASKSQNYITFVFFCYNVEFCNPFARIFSY